MLLTSSKLLKAQIEKKKKKKAEERSICSVFELEHPSSQHFRFSDPEALAWI